MILVNSNCFKVAFTSPLRSRSSCLALYSIYLRASDYYTDFYYGFLSSIYANCSSLREDSIAFNMALLLFPFEKKSSS
jgi:hypothetical protein